MITAENLEKELKAGKLNSIYLLYGEETFLLESCLKKIKSNFGERKEGINEIKLDEDSVGEIISDIETPAFGYEKKLIIARNTGLFKKEGKKKAVNNSSALISKLAEYIKENNKLMQEAVVLVFVEQEVEKNELYKAIEQYGVICEFQELKPIQITARLKAICKAYQVQVEDNTLQYFIECCGTNMQELINEIRKLIEYVGAGGTIQKQAIDLLCIKQFDSIIFDLTDNLGKRQTKKALEVLHGLLYQKEPIQKILITLYHHFKKLYIIKIAQREHKNIAESLDLKPNQMFLVNKYTMQANYFQESELKQIIEELINLDYNYKIGNIDLEIGLEAILCRYC